MLRQILCKRILPLTVAAALLPTLAASAQTPPATPVPPAAPAAPAAPTARNANRVSGRITDVDATAKTVTVARGKKGKKTTTLSVPDGTKIYKIGERRNPSGTFADLTVDAHIMARTNGDPDNPVATQIHLQAPKNAAPAAPATPPAPITPPDPVAPATPAAPATP